MRISLAWGKNFPNGYGHTSIAFLKRCIGFESAKNGSIEASEFVVNQCVKQERLHKLREQYPDAVLLPVLGQNQLPLALAKAIGLPIWYEVHLQHKVTRKFLSAIERLLHKPVFFGKIQTGLTYILVDDVVTQGGTISALREFVMTHGGKVVAVVALAYAIGSHAIMPKRRQIFRLMLKFGRALIFLLRICGVAAAVCELTNAQVKYLLRFGSVGKIEKKLFREKNPPSDYS